MQARGSTAHWAVMKARAQSASATSRFPENIEQQPSQPCYQRPQEQRQQQQQQSLAKVTFNVQERPNGDGRVDPVGHTIYHQVPMRDLHGCGPDNYTLPSSATRKRSSSSSSSLRTSYNTKAKEGYKYWYQDRPKPTSFGKYGIGSYKTLLGLGNGPRS